MIDHMTHSLPTGEIPRNSHTLQQCPCRTAFYTVLRGPLGPLLGTGAEICRWQGTSGEAFPCVVREA